MTTRKVIEDAIKLIESFRAILRHKSITPSMNPGVQDSMESQCADVLSRLAELAKRGLADLVAGGVEPRLMEYVQHKRGCQSELAELVEDEDGDLRRTGPRRKCTCGLDELLAASHSAQLREPESEPGVRGSMTEEVIKLKKWAEHCSIYSDERGYFSPTILTLIAFLDCNTVPADRPSPSSEPVAGEPPTTLSNRWYVQQVKRKASEPLSYFVTAIPPEHECWSEASLAAWDCVGVWDCRGLTTKEMAQHIVAVHNSWLSTQPPRTPEGETR